MINTDKIEVKVNRKKGFYAVWSEIESHHSTNESNQVYRIYKQDGTYVMNAAGWQVEKMKA